MELGSFQQKEMKVEEILKKYIIKKGMIEEANLLLKDAKELLATLDLTFSKLDTRLKYLKMKISEDPFTLDYLKPQFKLLHDVLHAKLKLVHSVKAEITQVNYQLTVMNTRYAKRESIEKCA